MSVSMSPELNAAYARRMIAAFSSAVIGFPPTRWSQSAQDTTPCRARGLARDPQLREFDNQARQRPRLTYARTGLAGLGPLASMAPVNVDSVSSIYAVAGASDRPGDQGKRPGLPRARAQGRRE